MKKTKKISDLDKVRNFVKKHKMLFEEGLNTYCEGSMPGKPVNRQYLFLNFNSKGKAVKPA